MSVETVLVASSVGGALEARKLGEFDVSVPSWPAVLRFWLTVSPRGTPVVEITEPTIRGRAHQLVDVQGSLVVWREDVTDEQVEEWLLDAETQMFVKLRDLGKEKYNAALAEAKAILGPLDWEALSMI